MGTSPALPLLSYLTMLRVVLCLALAGFTLGNDLEGFKCPAWLCDPICMAKNCGTEFKSCFADKGCRSSFASTMTCINTHPKTNFTQQAECMVPDNAMRDGVFNCMIEKHRCMSLPNKSKPVYPKCRDKQVLGDKDLSLENISAGNGTWYKVHSWKLGEPVECMDCQTAQFSLGLSATAVVFNSSWLDLDVKGRQHPMNVISHMELDPSRGHGKLYNTGEMFGLSYWEPYTLVKDGSREAEPFLFFYVCGGTLQGNYTTAFALAKTPYLTPSLHTRLSGVVTSIGLQEKDFCIVNNSCFTG